LKNTHVKELSTVQEQACNINKHLKLAGQFNNTHVNLTHSN